MMPTNSYQHVIVAQILSPILTPAIAGQMTGPTNQQGDEDVFIDGGIPSCRCWASGLLFGFVNVEADHRGHGYALRTFVAYMPSLFVTV